ncbi:37S ribosomal protein S28 [Lachancea thermotolerans]|uniref:KLTH0E02970p n=1 Tax=Lachancea thermotolerans (strain ATCC 56472 / CBS 6340 / NRRL Y-8284) TaxID=559295 RepID=C5DHB6_LACTC|nr:mitochondrial 37S ribosomal protein MRPS28 [Lachancea thermotolerans CBS 6340]CAR23177.1 KLTH0E02970p [Lachancea thermotolerans CBS 6340]
MKLPLAGLQRQWVIPQVAQVRMFASSRPCGGHKAVKFLKAQRKRQVNQAKQLKLKTALDTIDPVFGRSSTPFIVRVMAEMKEPKVLAQGYENQEVEKLLAAVEAAKREQIELSGFNNASLVPGASENDPEGLASKRESIMRILSMRNASNKDAMKLVVRQAREEFQRFEGDTGSSEVQAAIMTVRIQNLAKHIQENKNDHKNTRILRMLVQQRQNILRYLKRDKPERYFWTIQKLGLSDNAVVSEFNMDRRYMQDYKFFGDRILIKDSKKVADQKRRDLRKQKRSARRAQL